MLEFQKKKRLRRILYNPFTLIFLAVITIFLLKGVWGVYQKKALSLETLEKERIELAKLEVREKNLAASLDYLKTEQGIESEIRSKFRAVKEGEKVAVIIEEQTPTSSATTTKKHGFWYNLFH